MSIKGAINKSYIPINSEKLRNAIAACGTNVYAFEKKLGYKPNSWSGYFYQNNAMPPDLFFRIVEELGIQPEDIAQEEHPIYGRSWKEKEDMRLTWQALKQKLRRGEITYPEYVDSISKLAPYLVPKAGQMEEEYTPEQWNKHHNKRIQEIREGAETLSIEDRLLQMSEEN